MHIDSELKGCMLQKMAFNYRTMSNPIDPVSAPSNPNTPGFSAPEIFSPLDSASSASILIESE